MAEHVAQGYGHPWSGTHDDFVKLAAQGQAIVGSAGSSDPKASVKVELRGGREATLDSPEEFLGALTASDANQVTATPTH